MGCWNETCGITNLPIFYGNRIRVILIAGTSYYLDNSEEWQSGFSYSNDVWHPRTISVRGTYDDYGGIENLLSDPLNHEIILSGFSEDLHVREDRQSQFEGPLRRTDLEIDEVLRWVERNRIYVEEEQPDFSGQMEYEKAREEAYEKGEEPPERPSFTKAGRMVPVGLWMCHEFAWRVTLDAYWSRNGWDRKGMRRMGREYLEQLKTSRPPPDEIEALMRRMGAGHRFTGLVGRDKPFSRGLGYYFQHIERKVWDGELDPEDPRLKKLVLDLADMAVFQSALSNLRLAWMPQAGKGSQCDSVLIHASLANAVLEFVDKCERSYEDGFDDDDEEGASEEEIVDFDGDI
jgi:hypothetical protein